MRNRRLTLSVLFVAALAIAVVVFVAVDRSTCAYASGFPIDLRRSQAIANHPGFQNMNTLDYDVHDQARDLGQVLDFESISVELIGPETQEGMASVIIFDITGTIGRANRRLMDRVANRVKREMLLNPVEYAIELATYPRSQSILRSRLWQDERTLAACAWRKSWGDAKVEVWIGEGSVAIVSISNSEDGQWLSGIATWDAGQQWYRFSISDEIDDDTIGSIWNTIDAHLKGLDR